MKGRLSVISLAVGLLALGCGGASGTSSSQCAGPELRVEPARAAPGEPFRVHGENFFKGCDDTIDAAPQRPVRNVRVIFGQGDQRWRLATVDANRSFAFDKELRVPADAAPGRAVVRASARSQGSNEPAETSFRVLRE